MSNSSQGSQKLVEEFGGSFFHWVASEVLPYVLGSVLAICVLVGIILNIILLVVYVKRRLYRDPTSHFIPQIAVVDLTASFIVIIPSSVAAYMREWPLPGAPCDLHGVFVTWFHLLSFALVMLIFVERVVKAWNVTLHTATFNTHTFVVVISVVVWATDFLVALLPVLGIGTLEFNKYQSQCSLVNEKHVALTHAIFALGLYSSPLVCFVTFTLLFEKRRRNILLERTDERNKLINLHDDNKQGADGKAGGDAGNPVVNSVEGNNIPPASTAVSGSSKDGLAGSNSAAVVKNGPSKAWGKTTDNGRTPLFAKNPKSPSSAPGTSGGDKDKAKDKAKGPCAKKTKREEFLERYNRRMSRPHSQTLVRRMFRDSEHEKDHHQAMTALIMWSVLELCWVWYLVAAMLEMYSGDDVWGGWHTIGVLMGDVTYCVKPIVYLAHNRHYRQASKETMPDAVKEKADAVARKVSEAVDKVDNVLFKSPAATKATKFRAALAAVAAQKAALLWKRKAAVGIKKFGIGGKKTDTVAGESQKPSAPGSGKGQTVAASGKPASTLMGSAIAAAAMAQVEAKKADEAAGGKPQPGSKSPNSGPLPVPAETGALLAPGTPASVSSPASRQSTPGSLPGERPATKASVVLSLSNSEGVASPSTPKPGSPAVTGDDDLAQLLNPFSPQA